jgi:poly(A) polymerase
MVRLPFQKKTVVRERHEHSISRKRIDPDAQKVLYRLNRSNHVAYLVGGGVRDLLLGRTPKDFDVSTSAHPGEIKKLFRNCFLIGRRFRLAHIKFGTKVIETSTFRRQPKPSRDREDLYQERDNTFGTPEQDARRRDFTINGLFYDIESFNVIDYVGGLRDLDKKLIRCIGDPNVRFREDPVRMIRAIRFASRLDFTIETRTWRAIRKHHAEIAKAAPARLLEELSRLFAYRSGAAAMKLLHESGMMEDIAPDVAAFIASGPDHAETIYKYLAVLCRRGHSVDPPPTEAWLGVLLYPLYAERVAAAEATDKRFTHLGLARDLVQDAAGSLPVPKVAFFRIVHMFDAQRRLNSAPPKPGDTPEPKKRRSGRRSKRGKQSFSPVAVVMQESFPDAMRLREIILETEGRSKAYLKGWRELYEEHAPKHSHSEEPKRNRSSRRRRSGRYRGTREKTPNPDRPHDGTAM